MSEAQGSARASRASCGASPQFRTLSKPHAVGCVNAVPVSEALTGTREGACAPQNLGNIVVKTDHDGGRWQNLRLFSALFFDEITKAFCFGFNLYFEQHLASCSRGRRPRLQREAFTSAAAGSRLVVAAVWSWMSRVATLVTAWRILSLRRLLRHGKRRE